MTKIQNQKNAKRTTRPRGRVKTKPVTMPPECAARLAAYKAIAGNGGALNPTWAAWLLNVTHARVYQLLAAGRLECRRLNQAPLIPLASVEQLLQGNRRPGRPRKP